MCLVLFAATSEMFVVAANRDERFDRPASPASFWTDAPQVFAGRDLEKRGTWMGITKSGRFAAVTNVRALTARRDAKRSRGHVVSEFLMGDLDAQAFSRTLVRDELPGFNLVCGTLQALWSLRDDRADAIAITSGVHGLSNARLDDRWPKVEHGKKLLAGWMAKAGGEVDELFELLDDRKVAPDDTLPKTGVPVEIERALSASHIVMGGYGTRCATVIVVRGSEVAWQERTFDSSGHETGRVREGFILSGS